MKPPRLSLLRPVETALKPGVETAVSTGFTACPERPTLSHGITMGYLWLRVVETAGEWRPPHTPLGFHPPWVGVRRRLAKQQDPLVDPGDAKPTYQSRHPSRRCFAKPNFPQSRPSPARLSHARALMLRLSIIRTNLVRIVPPPRGPDPPRLVPCLPTLTDRTRWRLKCSSHEDPDHPEHRTQRRRLGAAPTGCPGQPGRTDRRPCRGCLRQPDGPARGGGTASALP